MSERPPYFPFYPRDFASDGKVEAMSTAAVGAYILLLCKAWHESPPCSIPDNDSTLARWARLSADEWSSVKQAVLSAWTLCGDRWTQGRLLREFEGYRAKSNQAKDAAELRWERERQRKMLPQCVRIADALPHAFGSESGSDPPAGSDSESPFKAFWRLYPHRVGKGAAERAWAKATRQTEHSVILRAVHEFAASPTAAGEYCPHPATWLNGRRWLDDRWTWWGKDRAEATKLREKWLKQDAAVAEWRTLTPEEQAKWKDAVMAKAREREPFDTIRQHWEAEAIKPESVGLIVAAMQLRKGAA